LSHPRLSFDIKAKMIQIRSAVDTISGKQRYIEVECKLKGLKRTDYFEDGIRKYSRDEIDRGILDSFCDTRICDKTTEEEHQVTLLKDGNSFYFGQEYNNQPKGNGILNNNTGYITIANRDSWFEKGVGHYLNIWNSGNI